MNGDTEVLEANPVNNITDQERAEQTSEQTEGPEFSWGRLAKLFLPHRRRVTVVTMIVLVSAAIGIVNPLLIRVVFDNALFPPDSAGPDVQLLVSLTALMLGIALLTGILGVVQTVLTNRLGQDVLRDLRDRLYAHLQGLSLSFYASTRTGDLQSRISSDVGGVQTAVTSTLSNILWNTVAFASAVIAMLLLSWQLTLVTLVTIPLFVLATRSVGRRREKFTGKTQASTADMSVITQETLSVSGITLTKLFGRQEQEIQRFADANKRLAEVTTRQQVIGQTFFTVVQTFLGATPVIVYLVAGLLLNRGVGGLTAGTIIAFTTLQTRLFFPVARLLETIVELQSSRAMFRRIFEYLDTEPDIVDKPDAVVLDPTDVSGRVEFDQVTFHYDSEEGPTAIDDVSFVAERGQLVAFVGASGAGKSTILNLIGRLYDPTGGAVRLDGVDLRDLQSESLASVVGFITQESYLFADTLRANISYGNPDATDSEIEKAARAAAIHDRITEFEDGYNTVVGERGFRLSGGEKQRIAIARVLLQDPRVLILDEATSALDSVSERRIQEALSALVSGRTTLAVAHRLSTIQAADVIHVVDRGHIVQTGTHDELAAVDGPYRLLYHEQFGDGEIETYCADGVVHADGSCHPLEARDLDTRRSRVKSH
jgi:ATP-binding cassette, subfamily B, bacterial